MVRRGENEQEKKISSVQRERNVYQMVDLMSQRLKNISALGESTCWLCGRFWVGFIRDRSNHLLCA